MQNNTTVLQIGHKLRPRGVCAKWKKLKFEQKLFPFVVSCMFPLNAHRDKNKSRELWRKTGVSVKFLFGSEAELSTHTATLHTHSQAYVAM